MNGFHFPLVAGPNSPLRLFSVYFFFRLTRRVALSGLDTGFVERFNLLFFMLYQNYNTPLRKAVRGQSSAKCAHNEFFQFKSNTCPPNRLTDARFKKGDTLFFLRKLRVTLCHSPIRRALWTAALFFSAGVLIA